MGHVIFIMHVVVMLELTLYQTKRKKIMLSAALFEWFCDMFIQQWVKTVIKMTEKPCANNSLGEDWKTKAIPLDQKLDVIKAGFAWGYLALWL